MKKSKNVSIEANKVEISTKQTNINNGELPAQVKPRLGLVDIDKVRKGIVSEDAFEKELGFLSNTIESQAKYGKKYCLFGTVLSNADRLAEKVKSGGYDVMTLDDKTILVRW